MTTAELARILQAYPQNLRVIVNGYEGDDDLPPEQIAPVRIAPNTGKHRWEGLHRDANGLTQDTPRRRGGCASAAAARVELRRNDAG